MLILLRSKKGKRHSSYTFTKNSLPAYTNRRTNGQAKGNCAHGKSEGEKVQKVADEAVQALLSGQPEAKWQAKGHCGKG